MAGDVWVSQHCLIERSRINMWTSFQWFFDNIFRKLSHHFLLNVIYSVACAFFYCSPILSIHRCCIDCIPLRSTSHFIPCLIGCRPGLISNWLYHSRLECREFRYSLVVVLSAFIIVHSYAFAVLTCLQHSWSVVTRIDTTEFIAQFLLLIFVS